MAGLFKALKKLFDRWTRQQESALWQMTKRKTAGQRIAGYSKSKRVDAKFILTALAPIVPVMISDLLGWSRDGLWHVWFWLSVVWAVVIVGFGFVSYLRSVRRFLSGKS